MHSSVGRTTRALLPALLVSTQAPCQPAAQEDYRGILRSVPITTEGSLAGRSLSSATPFSALSTVVLTPVLYCGTSGSDRSEYFVPAPPGGAVWLLEVPSPPAGAKLYDVRYEPLDNIAAVNAFAHINVWPADDTHINLAASAYPNCNTRIRLKITASYAR